MPSGITLGDQNGVDKTYQPMIAGIKRSIENNPLISDKVTRYPIPPGHGSVTQPYMGPLDAGPLETGVAYAVPETPLVTDRVLTAREYGSLAILPRIVDRRSQAGLKTKIGMSQGDAMMRLDDLTGLSLAPGITKGYGNHWTSVNFQTVRLAADSVMRRRSPHYGMPPQGEGVYCLLERGVITEMLQSTIGGGVQAAGTQFTEPVPTGITQDFLKTWYRGSLKVSNVMVFEANNIPVTDYAAGATDGAPGGTPAHGGAIGMAFCKSAMGKATEGSVNVNMDKDILLRGYLLETNGWWGYFELVPTWTAKITSKCAEFDAVSP